MIITIDGPSGTGKSTVAEKVAQRINFVFFDTGAMYRAVTWLIIQQHLKVEDTKQIEQLLEDFSLRIEEQEGRKRYFLSNKDITEEIRSFDVTANVSAVSAMGCVRRKITEMQRFLGRGCNAVFEGRDMGSTVFPEADLKIFLTALPEIRAKRRFQELSAKNIRCSYEDILRDILARDHFDSTRTLSPLEKAADAIEIDCSYLSIEETVEKILELYHDSF